MIIPSAATHRSKLETANVSVPAPVVAPATRRDLARVRTRSTTDDSLPDYTAATSDSQPFSTQNAWPGPIFKHPQSSHVFWRRMLRVLALCFIISLGLGMPYIFFHTSRSPHDFFPHWNDDLKATAAFQPNVLLSTAEECDAHWQFAETEQDLPIKASISRTMSEPGASISVSTNATDALEGYVSGTFFADVNPDPLQEGLVFSVEMTASSEQIAKDVRVCFILSGSDRGMIISVPSHYRNEDHLFFVVRLLYPQAPSIRQVQSLASNLPFFNQSLGDLETRLAFDTLSLLGDQSSIFCQSVQAKRVHVNTVLAPISGRFNVSQSLSLDTISGAISVDLLLVHSSERAVVFAELATGNSPIKASATVQASKSTHHPQTFELRAKNFDAPVDISVRHHAATSPVPVNIFVMNDMADSSVTTDSKFAGSFDIRTKLAPAAIKDDRPRDIVQGQQRLTLSQQTKDRIQGYVGTDEQPGHHHPWLGHISITSSMRPASLNLVS